MARRGEGGFSWVEEPLLLPGCGSLLGTSCCKQHRRFSEVVVGGGERGAEESSLLPGEEMVEVALVVGSHRCRSSDPRGLELDDALCAEFEGDTAEFDHFGGVADAHVAAVGGSSDAGAVGEEAEVEVFGVAVEGLVR